MTLPAPRVSTKAVLLVSTLLTSAAWAQQPTADVPPADAASEPAKAPEPKADPGIRVTAAPGRGFTVTTEDGKFSTTLRARFQMRETVTAQTPQDADRRQWTQETNVRTVRVSLQGHTLTPDLKYTLQLAFGGNDAEPGTATPLFDAWVEYTALRDLNLRVGQFFVPFDRARTIRESGLQFVDRQIVVTELTLDRDMGLMLSSSDLFGWGGRLGYSLGFFGGEGRNRFGSSTPGLLYVGRLSVKPFGNFDEDTEGDLQRLPKPRLMVGVAGAYNQKSIRARSTTGATFVLGGFDYRHAAVDSVFKYRGLSVLAEVVYRGADRPFREGTVEGRTVREWSRSGWGYLLQAGYMLNGTFETTARFDQERTLSETDPAFVSFVNQQGREAGVGLNAYLNGHAFKVQADYARQFGRVGSARNLFRLQLDASF
jgi:hypothetical protein